jgi:hypothetical protein
MGLAGGAYEAFAFDIRDMAVPRFFLTEDDVFGALERFTPSAPDFVNNPWNLLLGEGTHEWLLLLPDPSNSNFGTFTWTLDLPSARSNAGMYYPSSEGLDVTGNTLVFVCKGIKQLYILNLDTNTYKRQGTEAGLFEGEPDTIRTVLSDTPGGASLLYFTEDNGRRSGVHALTPQGELFTILEGFYESHTTGIALSPNGMFLYVCFQEVGSCFSIRRTDGLSFRAKSLNLKWHGTDVVEASREGTP